VFCALGGRAAPKVTVVLWDGVARRVAYNVIFVDGHRVPGVRRVAACRAKVITRTGCATAITRTGRAMAITTTGRRAAITTTGR